jgi:hypothetical protein
VKITFDANIFVSRPSAKLPPNFYMSAVVLQELIAGAEDVTAVKVLEAAYQEYMREGRLLVP